MPIYEYDVTSVPTENLQDTLAEMGKGGWKLVHADRVRQDMLVVEKGGDLSSAGVIPTDYYSLIFMREQGA